MHIVRAVQSVHTEVLSGPAFMAVESSMPVQRAVGPDITVIRPPHIYHPAAARVLLGRPCSSLGSVLLICRPGLPRKVFQNSPTSRHRHPLAPSSITASFALYTPRSVFPGIYVVRSIAFVVYHGRMSMVAPYRRPFATLPLLLTLRGTQDVRVRNP